MKQLLITTLLTLILLACKKSSPITEQKQQTVFIRVQATGVDTTNSPIIFVKL